MPRAYGSGYQGHGAPGYVPPVVDNSDNYKPGEFTDGREPNDREWKPGDFTQPTVPAWASASRSKQVKGQ